MAELTKADIRTIEMFQNEIDKYHRRIDIVKDFSENKGAFWEIKFEDRYSVRYNRKYNITPEYEYILCKTNGYNVDSVKIIFLAGDGDMSERFLKGRGRHQYVSIKFEEIVSYKEIKWEDLPTYVGMKYVSETFSKLIKG